MTRIDYINSLEKYYFERLIAIFEENGTTFFRNLLSQFMFEKIGETFKGKSIIADAMERIVQSIVTQNTDWDIFSDAASADSSFMTPKAMIHIDCKSILETDNDAKTNRVAIGKNQTSFGSIKPINYGGETFESNLPVSYNHNIYGKIITLTYILKIIYSPEKTVDKLREFDLYLISVPNGLMLKKLGTDFIAAGKTKNTPLYQEIGFSEFIQLLMKLDKNGKGIMKQCYQKESISKHTRIFKIHTWLLGDSRGLTKTQKDLKKKLTSLYEEENINIQRNDIRIKYFQMPNDNKNQYYWKRYHRINLR